MTIQTPNLSPAAEARVIDAVLSCNPSSHPLDSAVAAITVSLNCVAGAALALLRSFTERELLEIRPESHVNGRLSADAPVIPPNWRWNRIEATR